MTAVKKLNAHLTSIQAPAEIASRPIWLIWRFETVAGETKPRKVSYYATGGRRYGVQGRPEDRQKMVTLEAARAAAARRGFDGVGLAPMDGDFTVMDFDDCLVDGVLPQGLLPLTFIFTFTSTLYRLPRALIDGLHLMHE